MSLHAGKRARAAGERSTLPAVASVPPAPQLRPFDDVLKKILNATGADLCDWEPSILAARLEKAAAAEGVSGLDGLRQAAESDAGLWRRVASKLIRRTSGWFAEPATFRVLRMRVAPLLRTYPSVRIWVPAEAGGEDAAAAAILLEEENLLPRSRIYATALLDDALEDARAGRYPAASVRAGAADYALAGGHSGLDRYFAWEGDHAILHERFRRHMIFGQHSISTDGSLNEFHVILCRRALLDFNERLRARAQRLFWDSLPPLGVLVLAPSDPPPSNLEYEPIDAANGVYRRKY